MTLTLTGPRGTVFERPDRILGRVSVTEIKVKVCARFKVSPKEIEGPRRTRRIAWPRMLAMSLARELTLNSLPSIGQRFNRDHTTVLHACRRLVELRQANPEFDAQCAALRAALTHQPANDAEAAE